MAAVVAALALALAAAVTTAQAAVPTGVGSDPALAVPAVPAVAAVAAVPAVAAVATLPAVPAVATLPAVRAVPAAHGGSHDPFGNFDALTSAPGAVVLRGWAIDPDVARSTYVWVTVDGAGRHLYAGGSRSDVGRAFPGFGDAHGFSGSVPAAPGRHRVCVTAANVGLGAHRSLGCREVSIPGGSPFGNVERLAGVSTGVELKGWAVDPDTTNPIYLWVTVDGVGRHVYANGRRDDVDRAFGLGADHGYRTTLRVSPGPHRVCLTAANVGPGSHRQLLCGLVTTPNDDDAAAAEFETAVLTLTNAARVENSLPPYSPSSCAAAQARARAVALVGSENLLHAPLAPVLEACPPASSAGENLARGFTTADDMVQAWLDSPSHRANLLHGGLTQLGVGCVRTGGAMLCAQIFLG